MAKTFYTLQEAAQTLGKSPADIQKMVDSGELMEFKDGDQVVVKKDQVDQLVSNDGDSGMLGLADDSGLGLADPLEPLSLDSAGSASGLSMDPGGSGAEGEKDSTGISIFDPDSTEIADAAEQTQVTDSPAFASEFAADSGSSGSGLLDLTREADDTSLGADLLDDVYGQDTVGGQTGVGDSGGFGGGGGDLFESTGGEMETAGAMAAAAPVAAAAVAYDGAGSGLVGGLALGTVVTAVLALGLALLVLTGVTGGLVESIAGQHFVVAGVLAFVVLLFAGIGWFMGRRG